MGKKSSAPPKVEKAAKVEGEFSRDTARDTTYADRPNQYNPFGSVEWGQERVLDPATGRYTTKWTQNQELSEASKGIFDPTMDSLRTRAEMSNTAMNRAREDMGQPADFSQFGEAQGLEFDPTELRTRAEDASYQKSANRLDSRYAREGEALDVKLRGQGLSPGDQSYDAQMASYSTGKNDAYEQARLGSVNEGRNESGQLFNQQVASTDFANALRSGNIQEYLAKRNLSLSEAKALDPTQDTQNVVNAYSGGGGGS